MDDQKITTNVPDSKGRVSSCNVSQTFNFTVGIVSLILAGIIAYLIF